MGSNDALLFPGHKSTGINLAQVDTAAKHPLGARESDGKGNEFVYVQANGALAVNDIVAVAADYDVAALSAAGSAWGVVITAIPDNSYGWVQVRGVCEAAVETGPAAGARLLFVTGSSGFLNDAATPGAEDPTFADQLSAQAANVATVYIR